MASGLLFLLLLGIGGNMFTEASLPNHLFVCEDSTVQLTCAPGLILYIESTTYGRRNSTICSDGHLPSELQDTSCSYMSVIVAKNCNGHNSCSITASSSVFGDPCVGTYKYLDVAYRCEFWFFFP